MNEMRASPGTCKAILPLIELSELNRAYASIITLLFSFTQLCNFRMNVVKTIYD